MEMLRSILFWTAMAITILIAFFLLPLTIPWDKRRKVGYFYSKLWGRLHLFISKVRVEIKGLENVIKDSPQIFMANHQSTFDIYSLLLLPVPFLWTPKEELFRIPFFGWCLSWIGAIRIERFKGKETYRAINQALERVKKRASIMFFPEGSRSLDGKVLSFKKGGIILAIKSQTPIVPISISGSGKVMSRGSWRVHPGKIKMVISPPISTTGYQIKDKNKLADKVRRVIVQNLSEDKGKN